MRYLLIFFLLLQTIFPSLAETSSIEKYSQLTIQELKILEVSVQKQNDSFEKYRELGLIYHYLAKLDQQCAAKSMGYLSKALNFYPDDTILNIYYGSALTIFGRELKGVSLKINTAREGAEIVEEIYKKNRDNIEILVIYVYNCLGLPETVFHKTNDAFDAIYNYEQSKDKFDDFEKSILKMLKARSYLKKGRKKKAMELFTEVVSNYPESTASNEAKKFLKDFR